jgi:hypothetical protein
MPDWSEHIFRIKGLPFEILKFRAGYVTSAPVELSQTGDRLLPDKKISFYLIRLNV